MANRLRNASRRSPPGAAGGAPHGHQRRRRYAVQPVSRWLVREVRGTRGRTSAPRNIPLLGNVGRTGQLPGRIRRATCKDMLDGELAGNRVGVTATTVL